MLVLDMNSQNILLAIIFLLVGAALVIPAALGEAEVMEEENPAPIAPEKVDELVAFVQSAVAFAQEKGREVALEEFSNSNGSFVRGELYIYAYDFNNTVLAHPFDPDKIGVNRMDELDAFGNPYTQQFLDAAKNGSGFVRFYYVNPAHNRTVESKLGYVMKVDEDWWLGSGIYMGPADTGASRATP